MPKIEPRKIGSTSDFGVGLDLDYEIYERRIADLYGVSPQMIAGNGISPFRYAALALKRAIQSLNPGVREATKYKHVKGELVCFFFFVGWDCISLGFHICLSAPNIEIHLPFGFIRIGREVFYEVDSREKMDEITGEERQVRR